jgi:hypothetical protein
LLKCWAKSPLIPLFQRGKLVRELQYKGSGRNLSTGSVKK